MVWAAGDAWISLNLMWVGNYGTNLGSRLTLATLVADGESFALGWSGLGLKEGLGRSEVKVLE